MSCSLAEIYTNAGLSELDVDLVESYLESDNDGWFIESTAYLKLFDYFCGSEEMPYGVAKARTGEPDIWILEHLSSHKEKS
jgi:hypothetical protein